MPQPMKFFTIGPVQMRPQTLAVASRQVPYFRTNDFSYIMKETDRMLKELMGTIQASRSIWLTASGTAAMEATVMNVFTPEDKVLVISGGTFGERFVDLCRIHHIPHNVLKLAEGEALQEGHLAPYDGEAFTGMLVNVHETSTGQLYDIHMLSDFCKANKMVLVVDAISSFLCDEFCMDQYGIDVAIISSQKGLCLSPGLSVVMLNEQVVETRIQSRQVQSLYFNFKEYIQNMTRGQTPFTPAVGILLEANEMLAYLCAKGLATHLSEIRERGVYFRRLLQSLPVDIPSFPLSNALTPVFFRTAIAERIFQTLKNEMGMMVNPTGGSRGICGIRVAHVGDLILEDYKALAEGISQCLVRFAEQGAMI